MPHLNASQNRYLRLFSRYVHIETGEIFDRDFRQDVENLRRHGISSDDYRLVIKGEDTDTPFSQFLYKYGFPYAMTNFIRKFVLEDRIEPLLIHSGIFLVSEADESATGYNKLNEGYALYSQIRSIGTSKPELKLVIPSGVKLNEVKEFLDENWGSFVQPRMRLYETDGSAPNKPIRARRIVAIEHRLLELKEREKTSKEIAEAINAEFKTSYTYNHINQMYYRVKHR